MVVNREKRDSSEFTEEEIQLIETFRKCSKEGKELIKINAAALSVSTDTGIKSSESSSSKIG